MTENKRKERKGRKKGGKKDRQKEKEGDPNTGKWKFKGGFCDTFDAFTDVWL